MLFNGKINKKYLQRNENLNKDAMSVFPCHIAVVHLTKINSDALRVSKSEKFGVAMKYLLVLTNMLLIIDKSCMIRSSKCRSSSPLNRYGYL